MRMQEIFDINLPKWPQLIIKGDDVTKEQAKDIIFRTDSALRNPRYCGNDKEFEDWFLKSSLRDKIEYDKNGELSIYDIFYIEEKIKKDFNTVGLNYVISNYSYTAFIDGPYGFCSPEGKISFVHNIGKWPTVEEVYEDFYNLAKAFPYLNLKAVLMDGESCEEDSNPVVMFIVKDGKAEITNNFDDENTDELKGTSDNINIYSIFNRNKLGLPNEWYEEAASKIKTIIEPHIQKG